MPILKIAKNLYDRKQECDVEKDSELFTIEIKCSWKLGKLYLQLFISVLELQFHSAQQQELLPDEPAL